MPRLKALNRYWRKHPPTHILVAAYLGLESDDEPDMLEDVDDGLPPRPIATDAPVQTPALPSDALDALAQAERRFFGTLMEIPRHV